MIVKQLSDFDGFAEEKLQKHSLFQTSRLALDVYCLRPGQAQKAHVHAGSDKVYLVLQGSCRFSIGGELALHGANSAVLAPAGVEHGVENLGPMDARLLVMITPPPAKR
jgi:mannose-6-phosphate isomerase-like protein (cupin superfamily)